MNRLTSAIYTCMGKRRSKSAAKMGHVNILNDNIEVALEKARVCIFGTIKNNCWREKDD